MATDEKPPITKDETPDSEQDIPLTKEVFSAQLQRLAKRARAAGLSPLRVLAQTYVTQVVATLDSILDSLAPNEDDSSKKKKA